MSNNGLVFYLTQQCSVKSRLWFSICFQHTLIILIYDIGFVHTHVKWYDLIVGITIMLSTIQTFFDLNLNLVFRGTKRWVKIHSEIVFDGVLLLIRNIHAVLTIVDRLGSVTGTNYSGVSHVWIRSIGIDVYHLQGKNLTDYWLE